MIIAGIADKETPEQIKTLMTQIGSAIKEAGGWLRSGHSLGDLPFEEGAQERTILYLPWPEWNKDEEYLSKHQVVYSLLKNDDYSTKLKAEENLWNIARDSVKEYHASFGQLNWASKANLARMYLIVMGTKEQPVDAVVCWFKPKKKKKKNEEESEDSENENVNDFQGDPEQAVKIAEDHDIYVINLAEPFYKNATAEMILGILRTIVEQKEGILKNERENALRSFGGD